jgi:hypothetical protein
MRLITCLSACAALLCGEGVSAQDATRTQEQVSAAIASEGFIPVALLSPLMRACEDALSGARTVDVQKAAFEYCGSMLSSSLKSAMQFRIAEPVATSDQGKVLQIQEQLAIALAGQVTAEAKREELQAQNLSLIAQVAALRLQITSLQDLLDEKGSKSPVSSAAKCWVFEVGSPAAQVSVTVGFELDSSGRVFASSVRLLASEGGTGAAVDTALQQARRAILRCQGEGYLPPNGVTEDQTVELQFDAETMVVRIL